MRFALQFSRHLPGTLLREHKVRIRTARTDLTATVDDKGSETDFELEGARRSASRTH